MTKIRQVLQCYEVEKVNKSISVILGLFRTTVKKTSISFKRVIRHMKQKLEIVPKTLMRLFDVKSDDRSQEQAVTI